ncbi:MAG: hypothetical protein JNM41_12920 [Flavipsychrobacter sp.]|nr:hypothetical protein [Flavipsychrobacter sp.]
MITKNMKKYIAAALLSLPLVAEAQNPYTLKFLPQLHQSQWVNATNQSDAKISIGVPVLSSLSFYVYNSGFSYNSLFKANPDGTMGIHPGDFIDKLKTNNVVAFGADVSLFSANVALENMTLGLSVQDRVDFRFSYPKDLFRFAWYGNGAYIGQTLNIGNFGLNASWYREYALHGTRNFGKWTFGASPKLLFGKTNIHTKETSLSVYTEPDYYAITANAQMNLQTSGIADSADRAQGNMQFPAYAFNTKNAGLGIDLGVKYDLTDKIDVAAGVNNLGYINWKSNIHNHTVGPKSFTFDGFDLSHYLRTGDSSFISTDQYVDSVKDLIKFEKNTNAYRTTLPAEIYAIGNYKISDMHNVGAQFSTQKFSKKMVITTTLAYRINVGKHLTGALTYTMRSGSAFNLGGAVILRFAGMQWYVAADNWWASVKPLDARNANLNLGMNLVFGDRAKKKGDRGERIRVKEGSNERP